MALTLFTDIHIPTNKHEQRTYVTMSKCKLILSRFKKQRQHTTGSTCRSNCTQTDAFRLNRKFQQNKIECHNAECRHRYIDTQDKKLIAK